MPTVADDGSEKERAKEGEPREPECPFCGARDSEPVTSFGLSLMTSLRRCRRCRTDFEVVKWS
jgi:hypothetical protein